MEEDTFYSHLDHNLRSFISIRAKLELTSNLLDEQHVVGSGTADYYNPGREITAKLSYSW